MSRSDSVCGEKRSAAGGEKRAISRRPTTGVRSLLRWLKSEAAIFRSLHGSYAAAARPNSVLRRALLFSSLAIISVLAVGGQHRIAATAYLLTFVEHASPVRRGRQLRLEDPPLFITVQFPFVDLRRFQSGVPLLDPPFWPLPRMGAFVRSTGAATLRPLGGIGGWIGESMFCDASRAIRYTTHPSYQVADRRRHYSTSRPAERLFHVPFRRLYFDGLAVGKFELGFSTGTPLDARTHLEFDEVPGVLEQVLMTHVNVPCGPHGSFLEVPLYQAGSRLAQFYQHVSQPQTLIAGSPPNVVEPGEPVLFVQLGLMPYDKQLDWVPLACPPMEDHASGVEDVGIMRRLTHIHGIPHRVWMLDDYTGYGEFEPEHGYTLAKDHVRALRIAVLRLHAEKQALRMVQRAILTGSLQVVPRTPESDLLQYYLSRAVKRIRGKESRVADLLDRDLTIEWVRAFEDRLTAGETDELLNNIELLELRLGEFDFRPSILKNILNYQREVTLVMGDQYINNGQAGSMGPNSIGVVDQHLQDFRRSQQIFDLWEEIDKRDEWPAIQDALRKLTPELQRAAQSDEQIQAISYVLKAAEAADKHEGENLFYYLRRAGAWVADVAKEVGTEVMTKLILRITQVG